MIDNCQETNPLFNDWDEDRVAFMDQEDAHDIMDDNHEKYADFIATEWVYMMKEWGEGSYFDAGMFWGDIWDKLSSTYIACPYNLFDF